MRRDAMDAANDFGPGAEAGTGFEPGACAGPGPQRRARLFALLNSAEQVAERSSRIYRGLLASSRHVRSGDFDAIGADDLRWLFDAYDREYFRGRLGEMLHEDGAFPMSFRLSKRLVRAAGQTERATTTTIAPGAGPRSRSRSPSQARQRPAPVQQVRYEITISSTLLFSTFHNVDRRVEVGGLVCRDRAEALQRIFEHELLHLAEFLAWGRSNCRAANFRALSRRIFAHEGAYHDLVTPREAAATAYGVAPGDRVAFTIDGAPLVGHVNRITRRATVLVESPRGRPFDDGKRYLVYYVPLPMLTKLGPR